MKVMIFLMVIMAISINSAPFLRRLTEVTETSCAAEGKDFKAATKAQCQKGDVVFEVSNEDGCGVGQWTEGETCSATGEPSFTSGTCTGVPEYTKTVTSATCKADGNDVKDGTASEEVCKSKVYWTDDTHCSVDGVELANCDGSGSWTAEAIGACEITDIVSFGTLTQEACNGITVKWDDTTDSENPKCVITGYTCPGTSDGTFSVSGNVCSINKEKIGGTGDDAKNKCVKKTWEKSADGYCTAGGKTVEAKDSTACGQITLEKKGECSISSITDKNKCVGTYQEVYDKKCTLSVTVNGGTSQIKITDPDRLEDEGTCETELVWQTGSCSQKKVTKKEDCIKPGNYTAAKPAECVAKSNTSANDTQSASSSTNKTATETPKSSGTSLGFKITLILILSLLF